MSGTPCVGRIESEIIAEVGSFNFSHQSDGELSMTRFLRNDHYQVVMEVTCTAPASGLAARAVAIINKHSKPTFTLLSFHVSAALRNGLPIGQIKPEGYYPFDELSYEMADAADLFNVSHDGHITYIGQGQIDDGVRELSVTNCYHPTRETARHNNPLIISITVAYLDLTSLEASQRWYEYDLYEDDPFPFQLIPPRETCFMCHCELAQSIALLPNLILNASRGSLSITALEPRPTFEKKEFSRRCSYPGRSMSTSAFIRQHPRPTFGQVRVDVCHPIVKGSRVAVLRPAQNSYPYLLRYALLEGRNARG